MKICVYLYPGMTPLDVIGPMQALKALPNSTIETVQAEVGPVTTDLGVPLLATHDFRTADPAPDILLVGGAIKPTLAQMRNEAGLEFLRSRGEQAQWIVGTCTGSLILAAAGLLEGYRAASHWAWIEHLEAFGAIPTHERVVFDRNRCTGGGVTAGIDVGLRMVGEIGGEPMGRLVELLIEYNPAPPYGVGHPTLADPALLAQARAMADAAMPGSELQAVAAERRGA